MLIQGGFAGGHASFDSWIALCAFPTALLLAVGIGTYSDLLNLVVIPFVVNAVLAWLAVGFWYKLRGRE